MRRHKDDAQEALGRAIRQLREEKGLSQEALAREADLHPTWISHLEAGRNPAWATVKRISAALDVRVSEIAALAEEIEAGSP